VKKGINYWSFPGGLEGTKEIREFFTQAGEAGFEAVELCIGEAGKLNLKMTEKQCADIRALAEKKRVQITSCASGIYWAYNLGCNKVADRNKSEQAVKHMLQITQWLGADALLFIPGAVDIFFNPAAEVVSYDVVYSRVRDGTHRLLRVAEQCRVSLCVENVWNKFLLSPLEMRDFIDGFSSEFIGSYFDVGNVLATGYPEQWIRILGKRIRRVHLKDYRIAVGTADGFCDLLEGDVNWPEVMRALKTVGYDGPLTAELIPLYKHHPLTRVKNASAAIDAILAM